MLTVDNRFRGRTGWPRPEAASSLIAFAPFAVYECDLLEARAEADRVTNDIVISRHLRTRRALKAQQGCPCFIRPLLWPCELLCCLVLLYRLRKLV